MAVKTVSFAIFSTLQEAVVGSPWVRNEHRGRRSGGAGGVLRLGSLFSTPSALAEMAYRPAVAGLDR